MADPTPTALPTTDTAASQGAAAVGEAVSIAETMAEAAIIAAAPVMGTPVLKQIWEAVLNWLFSFLGGAFQTLTGYVIIDIQSYFVLKTAVSALAQLKAAQASGDQNAITQANTNADSALAPVLHFVGVIKP